MLQSSSGRRDTGGQDFSLPRTDCRSTGDVPIGPPTSVLEETSMSRRKVRRWVLQYLLWWPTSTWSSLRSWHWRGSTEELLCHLNGVRPTIKFTVEQEEDGALPFLDTLLRRREDGSLDVSVYRKPTHTDRYLHFESHHPTHVKRGVVSMIGSGGSSARRITFRRKLTT